MRVIEGRGTSGRTRPRHREGYRVAIAGGGSAGHVTTALAIGHAFEEQLGPNGIIYIGTANGIENHLIPMLGKRLDLVRGSPLMRENFRGKARALWSLTAGWCDAWRLLKDLDVQLVVGCGGYASAGVLLAARSLGVPCVLHEANALPGRANRLTGRIADKIFLGSDAARPWFGQGKLAVTGNPLRPSIEIDHANAAPCQAGRRRTHILVLGGSFGSPFLNSHAPTLLATLARQIPDLTVTHQTGAEDGIKVKADYARRGIPAEVRGYFDDIGAEYGRADFAITCGGAITLAEIAAFGLPSLIVPLGSASDDHQTYNARAFSVAAGVPWVSEKDWNPAALAEQIKILLSDPVAWNRASAAARAAHNPSAARKIADDSLAMIADAGRVAAPSRP